MQLKQPEPETSLTIKKIHRYTIQITMALQKYNTMIIKHTQ